MIARMVRKWVLVALMIVVVGACTPPEQASAPETPVSEPEAQQSEPEAQQQLVISHWGGETGDARQEVFFDPFEEETGIEIVNVAGAMDYGKIKAMVDAGQAQWDIANTAVSAFFTLGSDYYETIDYESDPVFEPLINKHPYAGPELVACEAIVYQTDIWEDGQGPQSWADFWDTEKFPGKRALGADGGVPWFTLEGALLATGVSRSDVYPVDYEKAFAALDELQATGDLMIWESYAEGAQMLANKDVAMARMNVSPIWDMLTAGNLAVTFNEAICWTESLHVVKGGNYDAAMKYLAFVADPKRQAEFAEKAKVGPINPEAFQFIPENLATLLPGNPGQAGQVFEQDYEWYGNNYETLAEEWTKWRLK